MNIGIIGGGFSGLTAGYYLAKRGYKVKIFEKSGSLGGLAGNFKIEGADLEIAYHHIFKTDKDILELVRELKLENKLAWYNSSVCIVFKEKIFPFMTPMDLLRFTPLNIVDRFRAGFVALFLQKFSRWKIFENATAFKWMLRWSGKSVTKVIWEPLLKGKFSNFFDKVSMAWLWARINVRGRSKDKGDNIEKLGYFEGGFKIIVNELQKEILGMGGEISINSEIQSIGSEKKPFIILDDKRIEFDRIISTTPSHVFTKMAYGSSVETPYSRKLNSIDYLGAVLLVFSSSQDISHFYWHNINNLDSPFLVFINHTKLVPNSWYNDQNIYYIGAYVPHDHDLFSLSDSAIKDLWFSYLKKIFPEFDLKNLRESAIFKLKYAQHIVDCNYKNKIPSYATDLDGVYLVNFSQIYPEDRGTNFAVREGKKIADIIFSSK